MLRDFSTRTPWADEGLKWFLPAQLFCFWHINIKKINCFKFVRPILQGDVQKLIIIPTDFFHDCSFVVHFIFLLSYSIYYLASSECNPPSPPCQNGGTCQNNACKCLSMFQGQRCESKLGRQCLCYHGYADMYVHNVSVMPTMYLCRRQSVLCRI